MPAALMLWVELAINIIAPGYLQRPEENAYPSADERFGV